MYYVFPDIERGKAQSEHKLFDAGYVFECTVTVIFLERVQNVRKYCTYVEEITVSCTLIPPTGFLKHRTHFKNTRIRQQQEVD